MSVGVSSVLRHRGQTDGHLRVPDLKEVCLVGETS